MLIDMVDNDIEIRDEELGLDDEDQQEVVEVKKGKLHSKMLVNEWEI